MKKIFLIIILVVTSNLIAQAEVIKAKVLASGLTCSLCSKATFKQLSTIPQIEKIDVDVKNTSFILEFKKGTTINPEIIKQKIEAAGFSVGNLEFTVDADVKDNQFTLGNSVYTFINNSKKIDNKTFQVKILHKGFLTPKEYKNLIKSNPQIELSSKKANSFFVELI